MEQLPASVKTACEALLGGSAIARVQSVTGGSINQAWLLYTDTGRYFLKLNDHPNARFMLETESRGLLLLARHIKVPEVLGVRTLGKWCFLLLDYVEEGKRTPKFWEAFGQSLALLHRQSHDRFGLDFDNFLGHLHQSNTRAEDWPEFYIHERIEPQVKLAYDKTLLWDGALQDFKLLYQKLSQLMPTEPPALIHGDLWGGNFLTSSQETPVLIDPAVYYGHREMDLAMSRLFGGFSPVFYEAYQEAYPCEEGLAERMGLYQLYYLLAHVNLFGRSYTGAVQKILGRYN
jgi:protein-ribulosamine 3-kinase